jgi:hypothetical protein
MRSTSPLTVEEDPEDDEEGEEQLGRGARGKAKVCLNLIFLRVSMNREPGASQTTSTETEKERSELGGIVDRHGFGLVVWVVWDAIHVNSVLLFISPFFYFSVAVLCVSICSLFG